MRKFIFGLIPFITLLILTYDCSSEQFKGKVVEFDQFKQEFSPSSEVEGWLNIYNCYGLRIYDSVLVAIDWKRDTLFQAYNLNSKKLIGAFGGYGKGPGEFFNEPKLTPVFFYEGEDLVIQIYDRGRLTFQNINLRKLIECGKIVEHDNFVLPNESIQRPTFMTLDSKIFGSDSSVLQVYNPIGGEIAKRHEPIQIKQALPEMYARISRIMYIEKAPNHDRIVGSFNVLKRLHIYNTDGELLRIIKERGNQVFDTSQEVFYLKNKVYFSKSFLSDDYILVLNENRIERTAGGELLLFDYDGNALIKYNLDSYVHWGAVDWTGARFYGYNSEEGTMFSVSLPGIGKKE